MAPQADSSTLDLFRERLASPFIFTFFWVSCSYNWKLIYWFLYEPLKPSIKLAKLPFDWFYLEPLGLTFLIIAFVPWINNLAEFLKRFAGNWFNKILHRLNFKEVVSNDEHIAVLDNLSLAKIRAHELTDKLEKAQAKEIEQGKELIRVREEISLEINKTIDAQEKSNYFEKAYHESKEKISKVDALNLESHNSLIQAKAENDAITKQLTAINSELNTNKNVSASYRQRLIEISEGLKELNKIFIDDRLANLGTLSPTKLIKAKEIIKQLNHKNTQD